MHKVFAHIVTFNNADTISAAIGSVLEQETFKIGRNLYLHVTDNASTDDTFVHLNHASHTGVRIQRNQQNLGFCGGHNQGAKSFLESDADFFLILNPDLALESTTISALTEAIAKYPGVGSVCAKLFRADDHLQAVEPRRLDSAGMFITPSLRHFDRGSEELDSKEYAQNRYVFGGTGACLLMTRKFVEDMLLDAGERERDIDALYPQLTEGRERRALLFDEGFFAYREDADLAWRGQLKGWKCVYVASAVAYHRRSVLPEKRKSISSFLNALGVKNRFLLQMNNFSSRGNLRSVIWGLLARNIFVFAASLLLEQSSLRAFKDAYVLRKRALARREQLYQTVTISDAEYCARWFRFRPWTERV